MALSSRVFLGTRLALSPRVMNAQGESPSLALATENHSLFAHPNLSDSG